MFFLRVSIALALLVVALALVPAVSAGDPSISPDPSAGPSNPILVDPLDPRAGAGANRVGAPLLALLIVVGIGAAAAMATVLYVKATHSR